MPLSRMFASLAAEMRAGDQPSLIRAARRAYRLGTLVLAAPGLPLGGLYALTSPAPLPVTGWLGLALVALTLGGAALWLARRAADDAQLPAPRAALTAAMQAATAPALTFLLGCAVLGQWPAALLLWGLAAGWYALGWHLIPHWIQAAAAARTPTPPEPTAGAQP